MFDDGNAILMEFDCRICSQWSPFNRHSSITVIRGDNPEFPSAIVFDLCKYAVRRMPHIESEASSMRHGVDTPRIRLDKSSCDQPGICSCNVVRLNDHLRGTQDGVLSGCYRRCASMTVAPAHSHFEPFVSLSASDDTDFASLILQDRTLFDVELEMCGDGLDLVGCGRAAQEANAFQFFFYGVSVPILTWSDFLAVPCSFQLNSTGPYA